jgi:uncharacterized protein YciI
MLFVIIGRDGPQSRELRPKLRPAHLEHLGTFDREGKIVLAGPLTDGTGSLIVIEAENEAAAREVAGCDPYLVGGVFESVEIHPFLKVLPAIR